ncbi:MAG: hypothetical protein M1831_007099 [Alyxoria varia]|nr:MAG: hypothetical protein M1831_007099 [Alyxoria varia]
MSPKIEDVDAAYREHAIPLTVRACHKAIDEWGGLAGDITHVVAVTATNAGNPGFDHFVSKELGIRPDVDRMLLHGVGCAGGLSILRAARSLLQAASCEKESAKILVFACEITSIQIRSELDAMVDGQPFGIGPALFSDGAAALMLCNDCGMEDNLRKVYSLGPGISKVLEDTEDHMAYRMTSRGKPTPQRSSRPHVLNEIAGFKLSLSKSVPDIAMEGIKSLFSQVAKSPQGRRSHSDFEWALHPGGLAMLKTAQEDLGLTTRQLRASYEVYRTRGNTSSVAVLAVLDQTRRYADGQKDVVACSVGPGMIMEMMLLKRHWHKDRASHNDSDGALS